APTEKYFDFYSGKDINHPYPFNDSADIDKDNITGPLNYSQIKNLLNNLKYNTALYYPAQTFHKLDANLINTNGVEVINIVGSGLPTLGQIIEKYTTNILGIKTSKKDQIFINGDKIVPLMSASLIDYGKSLSLLGDAKIYYTNQEHGDLVASGSALLLVKNILNNDDTLPDGTSITPYNFGGTIVSGHSPINIDIYDSLGNHTGLTDSGDIEENIPGSFYDTLDDAKFIYLPDEGKYSIKIEATDQGSFDLNIRKFEDSTNTTTTLYKDIPLTTDTRVMAYLDTSSVTPPDLQMDKDGNGNFESNVGYTAILSGNEEYKETPIPTPTPTPTLTPTPTPTPTPASSASNFLSTIAIDISPIENKEGEISKTIDIAGANTFKPEVVKKSEKIKLKELLVLSVIIVVVTRSFVGREGLKLFFKRFLK
ncbi:MAG: hypothetical protein Q7K55_05610, partial [Candidatus Levybacteria bacterium]|nr:hypothetical protein [Candidatus Levybacteria bacterium]